VNARKRLVGDLTYYDFDLAIAPKVCTTNNAENLGLGFCPYDRIGTYHILCILLVKNKNIHGLPGEIVNIMH